VVQLPPMLSFRIVRWTELDSAVRAAWGLLVDRLGANPTQHPDWLETVLASHGAIEGACVLIAEQGGEVVGLVPFRRRWGRTFRLPVRQIEPLTNLVSYHARILGEGCEAALLEHLLARKAAGSWHIFSMGSVVEGGATHRALAEFARRSGSVLLETAAEQSPFMPVTQDWPTFYRTKNTKFRNNLQRSARLVNSAGEVTVRWYTAASDAEALLEAILAVEGESWKSAAEVDIGGRQHETAYYRALLPLLGRRGSLLANVLFLEGRPIAYCLLCVWNGWAGFLKNTYVDQYKSLGAGAHLIHLVLERAFAAGAREIDFLGDALSYKLAWTPEVRSHVHVTLHSRAPLARLIGHLQQRRLAARAPAGTPAPSAAAAQEGRE